MQKFSWIEEVCASSYRSTDFFVRLWDQLEVNTSDICYISLKQGVIFHAFSRSWDLVWCGARLQSWPLCAILIPGCMELRNASPPHTERSIKHEWLQTALCRRAGECETSLLPFNEATSGFGLGWFQCSNPQAKSGRPQLVDCWLVLLEASDFASSISCRKKSQRIHENITRRAAESLRKFHLVLKPTPPILAGA